ncbi:MAG: FliH/SctL family protein [Bacillota bacterium]
MSRVFRAAYKAPRASLFSKVREPEITAPDLGPSPAEVLAQAREAAAEVIAQAKVEAENLVESAKAESAALREQASEEGYRQGRQRGYEEGLSTASELIEKANAALAQANEAFDAMMAESEPKLLALAVSIAKRVASESIKTDPEVVLDLVKRGMQALRDEREFSIHVDPDLVSMLEGCADDLGRQYGARSVEVVPDTAAKDGAIVRTPHGFVDATIESQIKNVAAAIAEARKRAVEVEQ